MCVRAGPRSGRSWSLVWSPLRCTTKRNTVWSALYREIRFALHWREKYSLVCTALILYFFHCSTALSFPKSSLLENTVFSLKLTKPWLFSTSPYYDMPALQCIRRVSARCGGDGQIRGKTTQFRLPPSLLHPPHCFLLGKERKRKQANSHLNWTILIFVNKCPKPTWQAFRRVDVYGEILKECFSNLLSTQSSISKWSADFPKDSIAV